MKKTNEKNLLRVYTIRNFIGIETSIKNALFIMSERWIKPPLVFVCKDIYNKRRKINKNETKIV